MCVAFLMLNRCPGFPVAALLNRDEFYARPARPAHVWSGEVPFVAGEDEKFGGTWAGVGATGRFALLTNYRDFAGHREDAKSRGSIVTDFLARLETPNDFVARLAASRGEYNHFNLIVGSPGTVLYYSSRENAARALGTGLYGMSNHDLDSPWPKVVRGKALLEELLRNGNFSEERLLDVMLDRSAPAKEELPHSDLGVELERPLAAVFATSATYGTRSSTLMLMPEAGRPVLIERTFRPGEDGYASVRLSP